MPWPTSERTIERPSASTYFWTALETSPRRLPTRHCSTAAKSEPSRDLEQLGRDRGDVADREGAGGVGDPAVLDDADVDAEDVAAGELERARDAVDDHVVRRGADRALEAAVALEGGRRALGADELLGGGVEFLRRHAGADLARQQIHGAHQDLARGRHLVDLGRGLLDDHSRSSNRSVASVARMWSCTSVLSRVPSKRRSRPRSS